MLDAISAIAPFPYKSPVDDVGPRLSYFGGEETPGPDLDSETLDLGALDFGRLDLNTAGCWSLKHMII